MNIEAVVLAAGYSSRAGVNKLTLKIMNKTIMERCIESMYHVCSRIIVVGGYRLEEISEILSKYPKVEIIFNSNYKDGMFSSVKEGIKHIKTKKFFLIPGDHPLIKDKTYEKMLTMDGDIVVAKCQGKKGHPVLIKTSITDELLNTEKYKNLREFIHAHGYTTIETNDPGVLLDIDTMEEYNSMLKSKELLDCISAG
jgi:molybdenum cofactor cytidylyltransferase